MRASTTPRPARRTRRILDATHPPPRQQRSSRLLGEQRDEEHLRLSELIEAGAERLVLVPGSRDADRNDLIANMTRLADDVLPALR